MTTRSQVQWVIVLWSIVVIIVVFCVSFSERSGGNAEIVLFAAI